jgi:hypothetical protein
VNGARGEIRNDDDSWREARTQNARMLNVSAKI